MAVDDEVPLMAVAAHDGADDLSNDLHLTRSPIGSLQFVKESCSTPADSVR